MKENSLDIASKINVDNSQVADIYINKIEEELIAKRDDIQAEGNALIRKMEENSKAIDEELLSSAKKKFSAKAEELVAVANGFKTSTSTGSASVVASAEYAGEVVLDKENPSDFKLAKIKLWTRVKAGELKAYLSDQVKLPTSIAKRLTDTSKSEELLEGLMEELSVVKRNLQNMSRYERRVRAKMAELVVGNAECGKELLAKLESSVVKGDDYLKGLLG